MPHSDPGTPSAPEKMAQVNGDKPSSAFLSHLYSYPLIHDGITTIKSNPLAAKSLTFTTQTYNALSTPILPYLSTPYSYITPYVQKADKVGDSTLASLDDKFPTIKKPTSEIYDDGKAIVFFPLKVGNEGKEYVLGVFGSEKKKVGGEGLVSNGKAVLATGLVVSGEVIHWLSVFLSKKKGEVKEVVSEKTGSS